VAHPTGDHTPGTEEPTETSVFGGA
jgi:hypothetical protein